ncbi:hypothetical protein QQ045_029268 [Rhodiola kirilowii]
MGAHIFGILDEEQNLLTLLVVPYTDINNIVFASFADTFGDVLFLVSCMQTSSSHYLFCGRSTWSSLIRHLLQNFPEFIRFLTVVPGQEAYAYYYPPSNPYFKLAYSGEKPPLLLKSHGGPTGESRGILNMSILYWTSRGLAFVDVNYGGSIGYGRDIRERLLGKWGIVVVVPKFMASFFMIVDSGKADGNRLCIIGGLCWCYTTLAALAFKDTFKAGASLYGVVVPPDQAREIYKALKEKGLHVALVEYEGEQHGFRKVADDITPIRIDNFD